MAKMVVVDLLQFLLEVVAVLWTYLALVRHLPFPHLFLILLGDQLLVQHMSP
jgi:hypothetical protein